ncbi:hypothetical protein VTK56DRAFT_8784 [Thermocarpiscus australiensis]
MLSAPKETGSGAQYVHHPFRSLCCSAALPLSLPPPVYTPSSFPDGNCRLAVRQLSRIIPPCRPRSIPSKARLNTPWCGFTQACRGALLPGGSNRTQHPQAACAGATNRAALRRHSTWRHCGWLPSPVPDAAQLPLAEIDEGKNESGRSSLRIRAAFRLHGIATRPNTTLET